MSDIIKHDPTGAGLMPVSCQADLQTAGELVAQSGVFGRINPATGYVIALTCHQQRMPLMEFAETYHMVSGKPTMRADTMLARMVDLGGEYEIISRTADLASIKATCGKASATFSFSWDQAEAEPFVYVGDGVTLKDNYATPRSRMQMLWARVVSDAVRTVCPRANKGNYTPEEVHDFAENQPHQTTPKEIPADEIGHFMGTIEPDVLPPDENHSDASQFSLCPIGDATMLGKPWSTFPTERLEKALKHPKITGEYVTEIQKTMRERGITCTLR